MGHVPSDQSGTNLAGQALSPLVTSNGVAELPAVAVRAESGPTDEVIIEVSHPPFREAGGGVFGDVLVDEGRSFSPRLGPP